MFRCSIILYLILTILTLFKNVLHSRFYSVLLENVDHITFHKKIDTTFIHMKSSMDMLADLVVRSSKPVPRQVLRIWCNFYLTNALQVLRRLMRDLGMTASRVGPGQCIYDVYLCIFRM